MAVTAHRQTGQEAGRRPSLVPRVVRKFYPLMPRGNRTPQTQTCFLIVSIVLHVFGITFASIVKCGRDTRILSCLFAASASDRLRAGVEYLVGGVGGYIYTVLRVVTGKYHN